MTPEAQACGAFYPGSPPRRHDIGQRVLQQHERLSGCRQCVKARRTNCSAVLSSGFLDRWKRCWCVVFPACHFQDPLHIAFAGCLSRMLAAARTKRAKAEPAWPRGCGPEVDYHTPKALVQTSWFLPARHDAGSFPSRCQPVSATQHQHVRARAFPGLAAGNLCPGGTMVGRSRHPKRSHSLA